MKMHEGLTKMGSLLLVAASACASGPPQQLVMARTAYNRAQQGQAAQLKPDALYDAKQALMAAEQAAADDAGSARTYDLAYVAQRKAQLAEAQAAIVALESREERAKEKAGELQGEMLKSARGELSTTREQLEQERRARAEADRKSREAIDKLAAAVAVPVKKEERGTVITLPGNVFFASGKSVLLPGAQDKLSKVAQALRDQGDKQIIIEGHTDSRGKPTTNMELSQRRAEAVRQFLVSQDVPETNVKAVGMGPDRPAADNKTAEGRAQNRRVEIIVKNASETAEPGQATPPQPEHTGPHHPPGQQPGPMDPSNRPVAPSDRGGPAPTQPAPPPQ